MKKRIVSLLLVIVFLFTLLPVEVFATDPADATISVDSVTAAAGAVVEVNVKISDNPGIAGATFTLSYHDDLTLLNAASGPAFIVLDHTQPGTFKSPCNFTWDSEDAEATAYGVFLTLTFQVSDTAEKNEKLNVDVSYRYGDVFNNEKDLTLDIENGNVVVLDYIPGDVYEDNVINAKDTRMIRQHIAGGYDITINEAAADVNDDGVINAKDTRLIRRYIAGGYNVVLLPSTPKCEHEMTVTEAKAATCTEDGNITYWHCNKCDKYYDDANGTNEISADDIVIRATWHTEVVDKAVAPTYETAGLTEGSHCSVCKAVLVPQEIVPILKKVEYAVTYHIANSDTYLAGVEITNNNPTTYTAEDGLVLQDLIVQGYNFKGWFTSQTGGTKVTEFAVGTTGDKVLYAQWEKVEYTVTFDSPDVPMESVTYTVDRGATLANPAWFGYTFVGWSNDNGFLVSEIKRGQTGNITLHANWTSNRNKATSYSSYDKPIIIEDDENGQFVFVYNIGKIDNVPLSQIEYIGNTQTLRIDKEYEITDTITSDIAEAMANVVSNTTTRSSGWTLSEEWEQIYSAEDSSTEGQIKSEERVDSEGNVVGGNYFVSNSKGGSSYVSNESGGSSSQSSKVTTENSKGINASYDSASEQYIDGKLGVSNTTTVEAGVSVPVKIVDVSAGISNSTTVSAEVAAGRKDNQAFHVDGSASSYVGTVNTSSSSSYYKTVANNSSTWNDTTGYEQSYQTSRNSAMSSAISTQIAKTTTHNITDSLSGATAKTESVGGEDTRRDEYSTTVKYAEGTATTTRKHITFTSDRPGYYRLITAGTIHVYAVVGYDVATSSYYTYTFNVLDDERHEYLDYSMDNANFNDCENGVVTFEVPYEVNEYVVGVTGKTPGLEFDLDGAVTGFEKAKGFDGTVTIPQYYSMNNIDGTFSANKTTTFDAATFRGNTDIKTVVLPLYITEIPDNAFEGCTNLETVIAFGITEIGDNAFKGCTSLKGFLLDNKITAIGSNAFENVPEISVMAANPAVADAAINSGAKKINLNLSRMVGSYDNKTIKITEETEYFGLTSSGITYNNLQIESDASETFISNVGFAKNTDTPIKVGSDKLTLARVSVEEAPGFAIVMTNDNTSLNLYGTINLSTKGKNAVISKNVTLAKANVEIAGKLNLVGDYLVCGEVSNGSMLSFKSGELVTITEEEFNTYLTSSIITFDPNGGSVMETYKSVYYGQAHGELPMPTRTGYAFDGWYTAKTGGEKVTADTVVSALVNQTLYAQWIAKAYNANWNTGTGYTIAVSRTSSPYANASTGALSNGAVIYFGDVLSVTYTANTGYTISSKGSTSITVEGNVTASNIYATATVNSYTASWNSGTGYSITVKRTSSPKAGASIGNISSGAKVYHGDVLSVIYSRQDYYRITANGSTSVTVTGNITSSSIYATAVLNDVSGWVKASELPSGAQIINSKWSYTLTEYTSNSASSLSGWTKYDTKRTSWGSWSGWSTTNPSNGARNVESRTEYHYYRWINSGGYVYTYKPSSSYWLEEKWFTYELPVYDGGSQGTAIRVESGGNYKKRWVKANYENNRSVSKIFTRTAYRYQEPVYTYYYKRNLSKEATSDPTGQSNVSNVVKWVQYRAK